jgi:flagellar biosynthesis protein FlhF
MKIKRYFAPDMRQAIRLVREKQGPDAVILSNRRVDGGIEIVAAVDYDETLIHKMAQGDEGHSAPEAATRPPEPPAAEPPEDVPRARPASPRSAAGAVEWSQEPTLVAMREEIKTLRGILEGQLSGLAWGEETRRHPLRAKLLERLMGLGLSPAMCRDLADGVHYEQDPEHNWRQALGLLAQRLPITDDDILSHGGVVAVVGPTGVGKTTTVAKLAARFTLRHGPNRVALVTTDSYRIGAHQQLRTYGRILGAPVYVANNAEELAQTLESLDDKQLVLIDTAGMSQRDIRLSEQLAMLRQGSPRVRTYVVLSATTQRASLAEVVDSFRGAQPAGCILTKVDESRALGEVLSVVAEQRLPVAYVADGQRVPEDMHPARAHTLVSRSVALAQAQGESVGEERMAFAFGDMVSNAHG